ncbi:MAG: class I SAM-dependent methyltransferase [Rhodobacteraceae bacterium]|nr:class I SAM-dependent methyltransferase [Paracoccaceae bacterium]
MSASRLALALSQGHFDPRTVDRVLAAGIATPVEVAEFEAAELQVVQPLQPDHDRLAAAGLSVAPDFPEAAAPFDLAYVALPRARDRARGWIASASARLRDGGWLVVDGAKTDGIDSLWRAARDRLDGADALTKAHGRLFWGRVGADRFADWQAGAQEGDGYVTGAGVFSAAHADPGSIALAAALPARLPSHLADLGAGWGYLAAAALTREGPERIDLVEADRVALAAAQANVTDPRAAFHWADALSWTPSAPVDGIVMNPPFHAGRSADPSIGRAFIARAAALLSPQGKLWLVANRHLPYETELTSRFQDWREIGGTAAFKLIEAARPRRTGKGPKR